MARRLERIISPLNPDVRTLAKLGSIVAHVEEFFSSGAHEFDKAAIDALVQEPDVRAWLDGMRRLALLPVRR